MLTRGLTSLEPFESWYGREHPRMVAALLLATGDIELASDGVDEACARALARWERVSAMEAPTGWAYSVALNHARRVARRRGLERLVLRRSVPQANVPAPASGVWGLVAELPERQRQVVVLRHVADLKEAEIASVLGISRSTVSTTLRDAHKRLAPTSICQASVDLW